MAKIINEVVPKYDSEAWTIAWIAPNPKVKGKDAWYDYEVMKVGMTIAELAAALRHKKIAPEIKWNFNRGFIQLMDPEGKIHGDRYAPVAKETEEVED